MTIILGIETSCDETSVALVNDKRDVLSHLVRAQLADHAPYGGVVPEIAARAHLDILPDLLRQALSEAALGMADMDGIAATIGPGLIGGVIVGTMVGKTLASIHRKPFIGINHLEAHGLTARLVDDVPFPYLLLLISGGHCELGVMEGLGRYRLLGGTLDDALGEAFDKVAKMMGLPYPGGPQVEALAREGNATRFALPVPLAGKAGCDFSFSGLKTAVRLHLERLKETGGITRQDRCDMAASFERVVVATMQERLAHAWAMLGDGHGINHLVVAGGVAANQRLGACFREFASTHGLGCVIPPPSLCTDNAAMIAWAGMEYFREGRFTPLDAEPKARWPLASLG